MPGQIKTQSFMWTTPHKQSQKTHNRFRENKFHEEWSQKAQFHDEWDFTKEGKMSLTNTSENKTK